MSQIAELLRDWGWDLWPPTRANAGGIVSYLIAVAAGSMPLIVHRSLQRGSDYFPYRVMFVVLAIAVAGYAAGFALQLWGRVQTNESPVWEIRAFLFFLAVSYFTALVTGLLSRVQRPLVFATLFLVIAALAFFPWSNAVFAGL